MTVLKSSENVRGVPSGDAHLSQREALARVRHSASVSLATSAYSCRASAHADAVTRSLALGLYPATTAV